MLALGRVCCDSEGRLNECSVLLEGSMELSGGQRVRLDLSKLQNFRVFPGQVGFCSSPPAATPCSSKAQHVCWHTSSCRASGCSMADARQAAQPDSLPQAAPPGDAFWLWFAVTCPPLLDHLLCTQLLHNIQMV